MRNLKQFPITLDEIVAELSELEAEALDNDRIGDMRPVLIRAAKQVVQRAGFVTWDLGS